jgi:phosphosulfolactate synthase
VNLGPNVNLGNVQPHDVLTLESTRVGLRGDTLRECLKNAPKSF